MREFKAAQFTCLQYLHARKSHSSHALSKQGQDLEQGPRIGNVLNFFLKKPELLWSLEGRGKQIGISC